MYKEKFTKNKSYENIDISSSGLIKNVRINSGAGTSEPKIINNPLDKNILAVSSNDFSIKDNHARIFISKDCGVKWESHEIPLSLKFKKSSYSDPWVDYDADGNLYFICVQIDMENDYHEGIFISKSEDNGRTWKTDLNFVDFNGKENIVLDRPKMCIDKSSIYKNTIYISWIEIKDHESFIMFSKSTDEANAFSQPTKIEQGDVDYCSLLNNSNGDLYAVYVKEENKIDIKKTIDKGNTWSKVSSSLKFNPSGVKLEDNSEVRLDEQFVIKNYANEGIRVNSEPSLTFSKDEELLITYSSAGSEKDLSDIYFARLNNKTLEISNPVKVNSDKTMNDQFLPAISADIGGNIFIIYQDSRNDQNNLATETFVSVSKDGGLTFSDEKLSTRNFNPLSIAVEKYFCDYNSSVISDNKLISVWTDGRNNDFDIYAGIFNVNDFLENMKH